MEALRPFIQVMVLVAGFVNAIAIGKQALELMKVKSSRGHSVFMYYVFLFIQFALLMNGLLNKDLWQVAGTGVASMLTTIWVIALIYKYRRKR